MGSGVIEALDKTVPVEFSKSKDQNSRVCCVKRIQIGKAKGKVERWRRLVTIQTSCCELR